MRLKSRAETRKNVNSLGILIFNIHLVISYMYLYRNKIDIILAQDIVSSEK